MKQLPDGLYARCDWEDIPDVARVPPMGNIASKVRVTTWKQVGEREFEAIDMVVVE